MRGTVRRVLDALAADNAFNFVISPAHPFAWSWSIAAARACGDPYLTRRFAIGDAPVSRRQCGSRMRLGRRSAPRVCCDPQRRHRTGRRSAGGWRVLSTPAAACSSPLGPRAAGPRKPTSCPRRWRRPWIGHVAIRRESARSSTAIRCSSRFAPRAAEILPPRGFMATARSRPCRPHRCSRGSTQAPRRCSSGAPARAAY